MRCASRRYRGTSAAESSRRFASRLAKPMTDDPKMFSNDPGHLLGETQVFEGTYVPVQRLFEYLAAGKSIDKFLTDFPFISREQVSAALDQVAVRRQIRTGTTAPGLPLVVRRVRVAVRRRVRVSALDRLGALPLPRRDRLCGPRAGNRRRRSLPLLTSHPVVGASFSLRCLQQRDLLCDVVLVPVCCDCSSMALSNWE